jgi:LPS O-antigen subunit length determinant protein (WzzB/FepE family)
VKVKLAEWASVAEILGAGAIVISLVFVGWQIRSSTKATQAATFQQHMSDEVAFIEHITSDPEITQLYSLVFNDYQSLQTLDEVDQTRAYFLFVADMRLWEDLYLQWNSGTLSDDAWKTREMIVKNRAFHPMAIALVQSGQIDGAFANYLAAIRARSE